MCYHLRPRPFSFTTSSHSRSYAFHRAAQAETLGKRVEVPRGMPAVQERQHSSGVPAGGTELVDIQLLQQVSCVSTCDLVVVLFEIGDRVSTIDPRIDCVSYLTCKTTCAKEIKNKNGKKNLDFRKIVKILKILLSEDLYCDSWSLLVDHV